MARDFNHVTSDRIDWASVANLTGSPLTISAWIYVDIDTTQTRYFFEIHQSGDTAIGMHFYISQVSSRQALYYQRGTGATSVFRGVYTDSIAGAWHHVLMTHDATLNDYTTIHLYLDGTEKTELASGQNGSSVPDPTGSWSLGGRIFDNTRNFDGKIAFVGVWNAVVNAATIAGLAAKNSPDFYPTNLLFYAINGTDYTNHVTGANGTLDGTTVYADPPQNWPWNKKTTRVGNESINRSTIW